MRSLAFLFVYATLLASRASATKLLDRNLVYSSPLIGYPEVSGLEGWAPSKIASYFMQFARDTKEIHARHIQHAKRQMIDSTGFLDEHYPTFYGGDFSNVCGLRWH